MVVLKRFSKLTLCLFLPLLLIFSSEVRANERADVLKSFHGTQRGELIESYEEQKFQHEVMFYMGVTLLVFVFLTAGFGIAMVMRGKEVFIQHMICAGVTVFLSVAHSVVAIVWFFPWR